MTNKNQSEVADLDFSERPVPPEGRMPKINLMMAWWGVCSAIFIWWLLPRWRALMVLLMHLLVLF